MATTTNVAGPAIPHANISRVIDTPFLRRASASSLLLSAHDSLAPKAPPMNTLNKSLCPIVRGAYLSSGDRGTAQFALSARASRTVSASESASPLEAECLARASCAPIRDPNRAPPRLSRRMRLGSRPRDISPSPRVGQWLAGKPILSCGTGFYPPSTCCAASFSRRERSPSRTSIVHPIPEGANHTEEWPGQRRFADHRKPRAPDVARRAGHEDLRTRDSASRAHRSRTTRT